MKNITLTEMKIKVSEIKKGDRMQLGSSHYQAKSDIYLDSVWKFDIGDDMTYGFTSNGDHYVTVKRAIPQPAHNNANEWRTDSIKDGTIYNFKTGETLATAKDIQTAELIVKDVNMHDELVETLKDATRFIYQNTEDPEKNSLWRKCAELLKQAE